MRSAAPPVRRRPTASGSRRSTLRRGVLTRARILDALDARGRAGVSGESLARALGLAAGGVRAHLRRMQREGDVLARGRTSRRRWLSADPPDPDDPP